MLKEVKKVPYFAIMRLSTGEEVMCKVVEETPESYIVSKPFTLVQGQQGPQFAPILMLADPEAKVEIPKPVIMGTPQKDIETQYASITSGIALPSKGSIVSK